MPKFLRHRSLLVLVAPVLVIAALLFTDPDKGASTSIWAIRLVTGFVAIAVSHWSMKAMFDYKEADRQNLLRQALAGNIAAGVALLAQAITFFGILMLFAGMAHADQVPPAARQYLPMLSAEQHRFWPDHARPALLGGQVEHETACPRVRTCWQPTARLKSAREEGAGFPQLTRTYRADGSIRFDALQELVQRHPALGDLSWENVYHRPDLQLRAFVMKAHDDFNVFRAVADPRERLTFGLVSHNRGAGGVQAERRACAISHGCDAGRWFGNVEMHCTASRAALYGTRSACDISRAYPVDILRRVPKYQGLL